MRNRRQQSKPTAPVPGWVGIKGVSEVSVDWDEINADPELQLWVVRVPEGVRSFLGLELSLSFHPNYTPVLLLGEV